MHLPETLRSSMDQDLEVWRLSLIVSTLVIFMVGHYFLALVAAGIFIVSLHMVELVSNG
jgi:hypothetical protein